MERRATEYVCPTCGRQLYRYWSRVGGERSLAEVEPDLQPVGGLRCPEGHQIRDEMLGGGPA